MSAAAGLYWWVRELDETGMSGSGRVAQVAVFEDGSAVMRWLASRNSAWIGSSVFYASVEDLVHVHGHGAKRTGRLERVTEDQPGASPRDEGCLCGSCGRRYRVDLVVPDPLWLRIRPPGAVVEAGLLCGRCVMDRVESLGDFAAYVLAPAP